MIISVVGCVEDNTVYDLKVINDVTISGIVDNGYEILIDEQFVLDPIISTLEEDKSELEYMWYYYQLFSPYEGDTISNEEVLNYDFADAGMVIGGNYNLTLKVRDNVSNVFFQKTVPFKPINTYTKGTLMLCKDGGNTELNFLVKGETLKENIYSSQNNGATLDANPLKVFSISPYDRNITEFRAVLVTTESTSGGVHLSSIDMVKTATMREKLETTEDPLSINYHCTSQGYDYVIANGSLHARRGTTAPTQGWGSPLKLSGETPDYSFANMSLHPVYALPLFYDNLHNRFILSNGNTGLSFFTGMQHEMNAFDANAVGDGMEMLCCGYFSDNNKMWSLMHNVNDGKYWILRFNFNPDYYDVFMTTIAKIEVTPAMAANLSAATSFESLSDSYNTNQNPWVIRSEGTGGRLAYVVNNKVYVLDMNVTAGNNAESLLIDGDAGNLEITKVLSHPVQKKGSIVDGDKYTRIDLCVKDRSISGKNGGVVFYKLNEIGGLSVSEIKREVGFCDEVIDVDEKVK